MEIKVNKMAGGKKYFGLPIAQLEVNGKKDLAFLIQRSDGSSEWGLLNTYLELNDYIALQKQLNAYYFVYTEL